MMSCRDVGVSGITGHYPDQGQRSRDEYARDAKEALQDVCGEVEIPHEKRAEICSQIRQTISWLDDLSRAVSRGAVDKFDFNLAAYELMQLAKLFRDA